MKQIHWEEAKGFVHDASGITDPQNYIWEQYNGIYYPVKPPSKESANG